MDSNFYSEFEHITPEGWLDIIIKDLKNIEFEKLITTSDDGIQSQPFYTINDNQANPRLNAEKVNLLADNTNKTTNTWQIDEQIIIHQDDYVSAKEKAHKALQSQCQSLTFVSTDIADEKDIAYLLNDIPLDTTTINIVANNEAAATYFLLLNATHKAIKGSIDFDPFTNILFKGKFLFNLEETLLFAKTLIEQNNSQTPNFKTLNIQAQLLQNAGATNVQQLAIILAIINEYIVQTEMPANAIFKALRITTAVGSDYFYEIAKLRALRLLLTNLAHQYNVEKSIAKSVPIHSYTSEMELTAYDPYTNILRATTQAMSAIIGGVDSLSVLPYNYAYEQTTDFSERLSRNIQLILQHESFFDKVIDPAAGSYFIENLTNAMAEKAWEEFKNIEQKGGYLQAAEEGYLQKNINKAKQDKINAVNLRKEIILGTNLFPNPAEKILDQIGKKEKIIYKKIDFDNQTIISEELEHEDKEDTTINPNLETIRTFRLSENLEKVRLNTERFIKRTGHTPQVQTLAFGDKTMRKARANFTANFFAIAGFEILPNQEFEDFNEIPKYLQAHVADIYVLCASDDDYPTIPLALLTHITQKGITVVAGMPKQHYEKLSQMGVEHFIHINSDLTQTLSKFQELLEII